MVTSTYCKIITKMSILNQSILDITYINTPPALILILKMLLDLFARWHFFSSKILVIVVMIF